MKKNNLFLFLETYKLTLKDKDDKYIENKDVVNKKTENRDIKLMDDRIFKFVFGRNDSKEILESFSKRVLERKIKIKDILNCEAVTDVKNKKRLA
jgi:hypothetical protein